MKTANHNGRVRISVVIPTRNRALLLKETLVSIQNQSLSPEYFEVIVVDNGSEDQTKDVVSSFEKKFAHLQYVYEPSPGLHIGRNKGLELAAGDIIVYADDDIRAFPTWLEAILRTFGRDEKIGLVGGNNLPNFEGPPPSWVNDLWQKSPFGRFLGEFSLIDFGSEAKEISSKYVWGCNYAARRDILIQLNGFHPDGVPSELIMYRGDGESHVSRQIAAMGYTTWFDPEASIYHWVSSARMTPEYIYRRAYAQGVSDSYTWIRNRKYVLHSRLVEVKLMKETAQRAANKQDVIAKTKVTGYWNGYFDHHLEVHASEKLLNWVLKEHYLGENGLIDMERIL